MDFLSARIEKEWNDKRLSAMLKGIVLDAEAYAQDKWKWTFTITSIYRTAKEDADLRGSGIHVDWRAVDVRVRGRSQEAIDDVTNYVNRNWQYDPTRKNMKVCFSESHGTGPHAHFQIHPRTKRH